MEALDAAHPRHAIKGLGHASSLRMLPFLSRPTGGCPHDLFGKLRRMRVGFGVEGLGVNALDVSDLQIAEKGR